MTVIYTETHLTSDPQKHFDREMLIFTIGLSSISVQCRVHRQELIDYILSHKMRTGDLLQIFGVFLTEVGPNNEQLYYININKVALIDQFDLQTGKKRKHQHSVQGDPIAWMKEGTDERSSVSKTGQGKTLDSNYVNYIGEFSDYFFMLYGKVQYTCESVIALRQIVNVDNDDPLSRTKLQLEHLQEETIQTLRMTILRIYDIFVEIHEKGLNKDNTLQFVHYVKDLTKRANILIKSSSHIMPAGLFMGEKVVLPTIIYQAYANLEGVA